jgi:ParB family chromosome partitioning protein
VVGKSRSHVANTLRLLKLSDTVKSFIQSGQLSAGHARTLIGQPNADRLAEEIVSRGLNVRQVEALTRDGGGKSAKPGARKPDRGGAKDADTAALEKRLSDRLGLTITIDHRGDAGAVHIHYRDLDQLDEVVRRLEES